MKKLLTVFFALICFGIWGANAGQVRAISGTCSANGLPKNHFDCHFKDNLYWEPDPAGVGPEGCDANSMMDTACTYQNINSGYYGGSPNVCVPCIPKNQVPTKKWGDLCTDNKECDGTVGLGCYPSNKSGSRCLYSLGQQEYGHVCLVGENECKSQSTDMVGIALACIPTSSQSTTGTCIGTGTITKNCTTGDNGLKGDEYCRNKFPNNPGVRCVFGECILPPIETIKDCNQQGNRCCVAHDEGSKKSTYYCAAGFFPSSQDAGCACNSGEGLGATNLCAFANNNSTCLECARNLGVWTPFGCIRANTQYFIQDILRIAIGIAGGIAFLMLVYAGFLRMTSNGVPEKLTNSNEIALSAIAGLLLIIFSAVILKIIGIDILHIPGLDPTIPSI